MSTERTLILFKPDCITKKLTGEVLSRYEAAGFAIRGIKMMQLNDDLLKEHYAHIADRPFFPDITAFMSSTPVIALILEGEDVIAKVRGLLGPTDSNAADKGTVRGDFGDDMMRNICHASDSPEAAGAEIARFFGEGEVF
ncbi:MAG: nucleoside-diphosphate kinase [Verrucomicrobiota bacterium]